MDIADKWKIRAGRGDEYPSRKIHCDVDVIFPKTLYRERSLMFVELRRILFPTDFSEPAKQAQHYAIALADKFDSELHLLHVVPQITIPLPEASSSWTLPESDLQQQVEDAQMRLLQEIGPQWIDRHRAVQAVKIGYVVEEIVQYAKDEEIDLIVLGTHGHTGLTHLLMGSTAEKVVRLATCPVLTVHPKGHQFVSEFQTMAHAAGH